MPATTRTFRAVLLRSFVNKLNRSYILNSFFSCAVPSSSPGLGRQKLVLHVVLSPKSGLVLSYKNRLFFEFTSPALTHIGKKK